MGHFTRLQTKLTVLYAGLFAGILLLIAASVYTAVTSNAERTVRRELAANGAVFDRVWALRTAELRDEADVLARDFGFRAAVATGDSATVRSALENLRARLHIDAAFVVGLDGGVIAAGASEKDLPPDVVTAAQMGDQTAGVFMIGDKAYHAAAAPVLAPADVGTVIFANRIDRNDLASLEKLAAIPLHACLISHSGGSSWRTTESNPVAEARAITTLATKTFSARGVATAGLLQTAAGPAAAVIRPLQVLGSDEQVALLITYPMNKALAPVKGLLFIMLAIGAAGFALLIAGSWMLARTLTSPLLALEGAAQRIRRGEVAHVEIAGNDEIGRLASNFNAMATDIRDREERLERARDLAESANRTKSAFLANMSHEVRTPLNGVLGVAGVLAATDLDAKQRKMVTIIESSAGVLQRVLCDVLDLASLEAGRIDFQSEPFALDEAVTFLARGAEVQAQAKGLEFDLAIASDVAPWVVGDRIRLEQILGNLLSNALKFTSSGRIELAVESTAGGCRVEVRDTGIGFDQSRIELFFTPFHQADDTITRQFGGAGLGLSIARDLARGMGGELTGSGQLGLGAVFVLTLPLAPCAASEAGAASPIRSPVQPTMTLGGQSAAPLGDALRVLIADDHPANCEVVRLILETAGIELMAVEDGALAVEAFKDQPFDAVIMDIQMPVMDGLTAVRLIREHEQQSGGRRTPILMLSANVAPEYLQGSAAAGADEHLGKPVVPGVLLDALDKAFTESGEQAADQDAVPIRILIADDHPTNCEVVRLILEGAGIELVAVEDGALAVEAFKSQSFDAVLMDIQMPVMDGLTAVRLIRQHEQQSGLRRTPILVLSANVAPEFLQGSAAAGADDHLAKPIAPTVLLEALDRALTAAEDQAAASAA